MSLSVYQDRSKFFDIDVHNLDIKNPKISHRTISKWDSLFPYYAGFDYDFAERILRSANMSSDALILDPWNGSGTTTYAASRLGLRSIGFDLNPATLLTARARAISRRDATKIAVAADMIIESARAKSIEIYRLDPLAAWFDDETTGHLRLIEKEIREFNTDTGHYNIVSSQHDVSSLSDIQTLMYVILFNLCHRYTKKFMSSNPTWIKKPSHTDQRLKIDCLTIYNTFKEIANNASESANARTYNDFSPATKSDNFLHDSTQPFQIPPIDLILTSPPYCTRIDYTSITSVQLAIVSPLLSKSVAEISGDMIGSTKSPKVIQEVDAKWGDTCIGFLDRLKRHHSKASSGYYYKTHIDYYFKIALSIRNIQKSLRSNGVAVLVVQDSYYKELHNDLPSVITEMAELSGLKLLRRESYSVKRSMYKINTRSHQDNRLPNAVEAVLCFKNTTA